MGRSSSKTSKPSDLSSYETACQVDQDLRSFYSTLQERTSEVIKTVEGEVKDGSISLKSLGKFSQALLQTEQEMGDFLKGRKDLQKNKEVCGLVKDYFKINSGTSKFYNAFQSSLKRTRDSQTKIQLALQQFEKAKRNELDGSNKETIYSKTLQDLKDFKTAVDPFKEEFFSSFNSVYELNISMLEKLEAMKTKLSEKLKKVKAWMIVSNAIFLAAGFSFLICSVFLTAFTQSPVLPAVLAAAQTPVEQIRLLINSHLKKHENNLKAQKKKHENNLKAQKKITCSLENQTYIAIVEFDSIKERVDKLEIVIQSVRDNTDVALTEEAEVVPIVAAIKKKLTEFTEIIEDLYQKTEKYSSDIRKGREEVLDILKGLNH